MKLSRLEQVVNPFQLSRLEQVLRITHDCRFYPGAKDRFPLRGQQLYKCIRTKKSFYMRKEFHPHRTFVVHRHNRHFIVLHTNMGAVTSYENDLLLSYSQTCSQIFFCSEDKQTNLMGTYNTH